MAKIIVFLTLFSAYVIYSAFVYTKGTADTVNISEQEKEKITAGKRIFEKNNCIACHQLYGLGGYLGPELTDAYSDPRRGELYMRIFLQAGGQRMPNYHFTGEEIDAVIAYLKYVDSSAVSYKLKRE
jgi:nitric oxide reductase subunit C